MEKGGTGFSLWDARSLTTACSTNVGQGFRPAAGLLPGSPVWLRPRRPLLLLLIPLLLAPLGCKQRRRRIALQAAEETAVASMVSAADPRATSQFAKGFYPVEGGSWRWTAKDFTVNLSPPRGAAQNGAQLVLEFSVPEVVIQRLKSITLSASIDGLKLTPEQYTSTGIFSYVRAVPADKLQTQNIPVDFTLDKALPPTAADSRELGIIVTQAGFKIK
ncbi:MAG TPA: hypothetical protein VGV35_13590 [Bryobacteraceae bacterium]|nr:hypothetical protein [Bryobacteraceae bacterium]